jgi:glycosyltransferase involved in cell wall biosynthesis
MPMINILTWYNGSAGLDKDAYCLGAVLTEAGFSVTQTNILLNHSKYSHIFKPFLSKLGRLGYLIDRAFYIYHNYAYRITKILKWKTKLVPKYDINLFIECVDTSYFEQARKNCFIPNQEWFSIWKHMALKSFDKVLCKTMYAYRLFRDLGIDSEYISFTGIDLSHPELTLDYDACLHIGGKSLLKGTLAVVRVWEKHPEWPVLCVVHRTLTCLSDRELPANIIHISTRLEEAQWIEMQQRYGIRIQPSEAEGFGHVLIEGMALGAVIITTDAPPMNELISLERGQLVAFDRTEALGLGARYFVDLPDLEQQIMAMLQLNLDERRTLGNKAREWYLQNDTFFKRRIVEVMRGLLAE